MAADPEKLPYIDIKFFSKIRNRDISYQSVTCRTYIDEETRKQFVKASQIAQVARASSQLYEKIKSNDNQSPREYFGLTCSYPDKRIR